MMISHDKFVEIVCLVADINVNERGGMLVAIAKVMVESDQGIQEWIRAHIVGTCLPKSVKLVDGLPYHQGKIYVPNNVGVKAQVLALYHDSLMAGHLSQQGTSELIT